MTFLDEEKELMDRLDMDNKQHVNKTTAKRVQSYSVRTGGNLMEASKMEREWCISGGV